jgi:hypothetical protein
MNNTKQEVNAVEDAASVQFEAACRDLSEVELSLVGGGTGDITLG